MTVRLIGSHSFGAFAGAVLVLGCVASCVTVRQKTPDPVSSTKPIGAAAETAAPASEGEPNSSQGPREHPGLQGGPFVIDGPPATFVAIKGEYEYHPDKYCSDVMWVPMKQAEWGEAAVVGRIPCGGPESLAGRSQPVDEPSAEVSNAKTKQEEEARAERIRQHQERILHHQESLRRMRARREARESGRDTPPWDDIRKTTPGHSFFAMSRAAFDRLDELALAGDEAGVKLLVLGGLVMTVPSGTEVLVIKTTGFISRVSEVRLRSGSLAGLSGFMYESDLKR